MKKLILFLVLCATAVAVYMFINNMTMDDVAQKLSEAKGKALAPLGSVQRTAENFEDAAQNRLDAAEEALEE